MQKLSQTFYYLVKGKDDDDNGLVSPKIIAHLRKKFSDKILFERLLVISFSEPVP